MTPGSSRRNPPQSGNVDIEFLRQRQARRRFIASAQVAHLISRQRGHVVLFTSCVRVSAAVRRSAFTLPISHVGRLITEIQVSWVNAARVRATWTIMAKHDSAGDRSMRQLPGDPMGLLCLRSELAATKESVTASLERPGPEPAAICLVHKAPEAVFPRLDLRCCIASVGAIEGRGTAGDGSTAVGTKAVGHVPSLATNFGGLQWP